MLLIKESFIQELSARDLYISFPECPTGFYVITPADDDSAATCSSCPDKTTVDDFYFDHDGYFQLNDEFFYNETDCNGK